MFVTEGPVDPESPLFVGRDAELSQMEAWLGRTHCVGAVMGARQTGKTSLLLRLRHLLRGKYSFVFIDLEAVAGADITECVTYIAAEITSQLADQLGTETLRLPEKSNEFLGFLERCARAAKGVRIIVLLDEIGALLPDTSLRLTSAIRAVFTSRHVKPEFGRFVFVVAGAMDMLDLTTGRSSPLKNVAETVYVGDLSISETERLVAEMFGSVAQWRYDDLPRALHEWTAGHPYWTQRLGEELQRQSRALSDGTVRHVVEQLLHTEDRNLPHIFHALEADRTLSGLATALVSGTPVTFSRSNRTIARLELIGLLKNERGHCVIRNRIYKVALERQPLRPRVAARNLRQVRERLLEAPEPDALFQVVALELQAALQNCSVVILRRVNQQIFEIASSVGCSPDAISVSRLSTPESKLNMLTAPADPRDLDLSPAEFQFFERINPALVVPARVNGITEAVLCLGSKLSGDDFDAEDHEFLIAVAEQTAMCQHLLRLRMIERDAQKAAGIQQELLPKEIPEIVGVHVAGSCHPARMVGGDYYDVLKLSDRTVAFCVGDVVGKGMPAALLMASLQAAVKTLSPEQLSPRVLCDRLNQLVARTVKPGQFITFFYAILDVNTHQLVYTNAGHNPPIVVDEKGRVIRLEGGGLILGIFADQTYTESTETLNPGSRLLMFTDGVTEVCNAQGEEFGDERLIAIVNSNHHAHTLHEHVIDAVTNFSESNFNDDVTVLAVTC